MKQPCKVCDALAFRTLHKLCARLTRKMPYALYLAALHVQNAAQAEAQCLRLLSRGEVVCRMQENCLYILLFAGNDDEAQRSLAPLLRALPNSALRISRVTQRLAQDPSFDE